jgi:capsular polysaccharide transport system permease protein
MASLRQGWNIQVRVIGALMLRELTTRFGRENIGFLWVMGEPLLFAVLVGVLWRGLKGPFEFGLDIVAFVVTGYLPLVMFRSAVNRGVKTFTVNGSLMYHRQVKILDLLLVRFIIEVIGHAMAYVFIALLLGVLGFFPQPYDLGFLLLGGFYYALFTFSIMLIVAPLSEVSEVIEKIIPVTTYLMIPFSGAFYLMSTLSPEARNVLLYSPPVHGMEMMRYGVFGPTVDPYFEYGYPIAFCLPCIAVGLVLCRLIRKNLVIE